MASIRPSMSAGCDAMVWSAADIGVLPVLGWLRQPASGDLKVALLRDAVMHLVVDEVFVQEGAHVAEALVIGAVEALEPRLIPVILQHEGLLGEDVVAGN